MKFNGQFLVAIMCERLFLFIEWVLYQIDNRGRSCHISEGGGMNFIECNGRLKKLRMYAATN